MFLPPFWSKFQKRLDVLDSLPCSTSQKICQVVVLGFNNTSIPVGHFVSSPREREKRDRRNSSDEREGHGRKKNRNESEETEEMKTFLSTLTCYKDSKPCPAVSQYQLDAPVTKDTRHLRNTNHPQNLLSTPSPLQRCALNNDSAQPDQCLLSETVPSEQTTASKFRQLRLIRMYRRAGWFKSLHGDVITYIFWRWD